MRIAVSGTHITGKSTLVAALGECLPHHTLVAEPYEMLVERGYAFAPPPDIDDYIVQLKQSLLSLRRQSPNRIFDRCPLDVVGYLLASPGAKRFDLEAWRAPIVRAMQSLDLVVAVHADLRIGTRSGLIARTQSRELVTIDGDQADQPPVGKTCPGRCLRELNLPHHSNKSPTLSPCCS